MSLTTYITSVLGSFYSFLDWTSDYTDFVISETLESYGVDSEDLATDTTKLHALAKVETWKKVLTEVSHNYNFSADGASYSRSQIFDMVKQNYNDAKNKAIQYLPTLSIETGEITFKHDPYDDTPWSERED